MRTSLDPGSGPRDFAAVYRQHYSFVWRTLRHLGVDDARVDDALQDTFLVVHRRLDEFAGRAALRTWLFEIARRVAARYRRAAARDAPRRDPLPELEDPHTVDDSLARAEAAEILQLFLARLDPDKSVVFVLAELERWRAPEIAAELDLNLNTVYARLRAARIELDRLIHRLSARDRRPRARSGAQVLAVALVGPPPPPPPLRLDLPAPPEVFQDMSLQTLPVGHSWQSALLGAGAPGLAVTALALAAIVAFAPDPAAAPDPASTVARAHDPAAVPSLAAPPPASTIAHTLDPTLAPARASTSDLAPPAPDLTVADGALAPPPAPGLSVASTHFADVALARGAGDPVSLAAELALVESIRAAILADDGRRALTLIARYRRRFPAGAFAQEVAAAAVEARCQTGDVVRARREADAFAARWPESTLVAGVRAMCDR